PAGFYGERPDTGVTIAVAVRGDFEMTVCYEILAEPTPADAGQPQSRVTLDVGADRASNTVATLSRRVAARGGTQLVAWRNVGNHASDTQPSRYKEFASQSRIGRLRLARTGSMLSYYAADGPDSAFTLLQKFPFSAEELENIRVVASTGGPKAALDVRFTDLS